MKRRIVVFAALSTIAVAIAGPRITAQQPVCLHGPGEAESQRVRRQQALRLTRQINTAENAAHSTTGTYPALSALSNIGNVPEGFLVHLATDGAAYAFSVKDSTDPCS